MPKIKDNTRYFEIKKKEMLNLTNLIKMKKVDPKRVDVNQMEANSKNLKMLCEEFIVEVFNALDECPE